MMSETASNQSSPRSSTILNRPHIAPIGPRTRQSRLSSRSSALLEFGATSSLTLDLPEFGGGESTAPIRFSSSSSTTSSLSRPKSLQPVSEEGHASPELAPAYDHNEERRRSAPEYPSTSQMSLPVGSIDLPVPVESSPPTSAKVVLAPPPFKLVPPLAIKFESTPIPWKGLPLEAALWTVDSGELQAIVSRAIRSSAKESFIRLLTVNNLDTVLPAELERLDELKAVTQSKYRFLVHRRTMMFHALNSTSLEQKKDGEDGVPVVSKLVSQLADTITECDQTLEKIINITDQVAQINKLIDIHWSGALAIALRKLNASYARRTASLNTAKERITQLESELEDAWKEAERMAKELDDYEAAITADDTEAIIELAEVVPVPTTAARRNSTPMTATLLTFTPVSSLTPKEPLSPVSPSQFVFPPAVHLKEKQTEAEDVPDTVSTRSSRSGKSSRSRRSEWTTESHTHASVVHAAKTRSHRASQGSLRLNMGHKKKYSRATTSFDDQPPVPELPLRFTPFNSIMSAPSANASSTLLHDGVATPQLRRQVSLDSVCTGIGRPVPSAWPGRAADDLYIRLQTQYQYQHQNRSSQEIQVVPRTPAAQNFASMYEQQQTHNPTAPRPQPKTKAKILSTMGMNVDAHKSHMKGQFQSYFQSHSHSQSRPSSSTSGSDLTQSSNTLPRTSTRSAYNKIRGLTKRYSVSLPLFNTQTRSTGRRSE